MKKIMEKNNKVTSPQYKMNNDSFGNSFDSIDSGYLSFSPQSSSYEAHSKVLVISEKRYHKYRSEPYKSTINQEFNQIHTNFYSNAKQSSLKISERNSNIHLKHSFVKNKYVNSSFKMELRSQRKKKLEAISSSSITFANYKNNSFSKAVVKPSLLAVPLSPFTNNNSEMNIVIPESTPYVINSPTLTVPLCKTIFTPIRYKINSAVISENTKKFSNIFISDKTFIIKKTKPKKLDFSKRAIFASLQRQRVIPDFTGQETVDIFKFLGEKTNHPRIVSKILDYLSPQDLCSINMVSKSWKRICNNDRKAQDRRLKHIIIRESSKENFTRLSKCKLQEIQLSPKSRHPRKGFLTSVSSNLLQKPKIHLTPNSPPVSPSKIIFHSFIKAGRSLAPRDQLIPCPLCKFACRIELEKNIGKCSRKGCQMETFCVLCSSKLHLGEPCKMPLLATPTKKDKRQQHVAGTKQSRRSLRRISRLI